MQIKLVQDSIIFVSALHVETFAKAEKFIPEALTLYSEDDSKKKTPVCTIGYAECGGVNKNGIIFDATTDSGKLCHTIVNMQGFDPHLSTVEKLRVVSEKYSSLILNMNKLEEQIASKLADKETEITIASRAITAIAIEENVACCENTACEDDCDRTACEA